MHCRAKDYAASNPIDPPRPARTCVPKELIFGCRLYLDVGGKKWGKKHRKGNIFRASNMSVVDFDFSPVSGPRKVITPARCSITDQPASPSCSLSLAFEEEPIITSYRFSVEIFADSPLPS